MSEPILSVRDLNLEFYLSRHDGASLRDIFVRALREPGSFFRNRYEPLTVSRGISFDIFPGDRVGLVGRNGAGKTSLCRCLAGFFAPTSGTVKRPANVRALLDSTIGIYPELTGRENAKLLAQILAPMHPRLDEAVEEALEFSELGKFVDVPIRQYSKGMLVRLGLSVNAMLPAELLVLDEVFDGADVFFQKKIANRMMDLIALSSAAIFVSHSFDQVRKVCNRILILDSGSLIYDGSVEEGLSRFLSPSAPSPQPAREPDLYV